MGNRANVIFTSRDGKQISPAVYLYWDGGPASIYSFLDELERRGCNGHESYSAARFVHVVADYFDSEGATSQSLGIMPGPRAITAKQMERYDLSDNGVFVVSYPKGNRHVRRFVRTDDYNTAREMTASEVFDERERAYKHPYHVLDKENKGRSIAEVLFTLRPRISTH